MAMQNSLLIVDDDTLSLMELSHILSSQYKIHAVKDGTSAVSDAVKFLPDLIILDVVMPGMSGFDVYSELRKHEETKDIPVIFITRENDSESAGLTIGAVDYIHKPYNESVVKLRVSNQINIINFTRDLEQAAEVAEAANRSKSSFLANISHEIRTPMNAVLGLTKLLMEDETLSDSVQDKLEKIYASSDLLLSIINDLLDFSKIEAGKLDIVPAEYSVANLLNDSIQLNIIRIGGKPIEFKLEIDENIPAKLIGDELRIKQILNNLLSNAFKYTESGSVTLCVNYGDGIISYSVRDTGHGMTKAQLEKLFSEYTRFDESKSIEGTGLGLTITLSLAKLMSGDISVESEAGKGSVFTVKIPQKSMDDEKLGKETAENLRQFRIKNTRLKENKIKRVQMPGGSVLIVDDVETNLYVASGLMELYGLTIDQSSGGRDAINKIKNGETYDIIFMDHMMPGMDGIEATKILREMDYKGTIVALTANALTGNAEMFAQHGFDDFLSKPIYVEELNTILVKYMGDKQVEVPVSAEKPKQQINIRLMESFILDAKNAISELEHIFGSGDFTDKETIRSYTTVTHGIKGALYCVEENALAEKALKLERTGSAGVIVPAPGFIKELRKLVESYEKILSEQNTSDDETDLQKAFSEIIKMCEDYDRKGALDIISGIRTNNKETKELLMRIKIQITNSDFETAENAISTYLRSVW